VKIPLKYRIHILLWGMMILYLIIAPIVYGKFIVDEGKPIEFNVSTTIESPNIKCAIEKFQPITINNDDFYHLWGWSFFDDNIVPTDYDRFILLESEDKRFYFATHASDRPDVENAYQVTSRAIIDEAGFFTYVSKSALPIGMYHIKIIYQHRVSKEAYEVDTGDIVKRTGNQLLLIGGGFPVSVNPSSIIPSDKIEYNIEHLGLVEAYNKEVYNLWGWSFLNDDGTAVDCDRFILLEKRDKKYYFPINVMDRPDVENVYQDISKSLINEAGFYSYILKSELPMGTYEINIVYQNKQTKEAYAVNTGFYIKRTFSQLVLIDKRP